MSLWFYERDGKSNGPIEEFALARMIGSAELSTETRVWTDEFGSEWKVASQTRLIDPKVAPPPLPPPQGKTSIPPIISSERIAKDLDRAELTTVYAYPLALSPLLITAAELIHYSRGSSDDFGLLAALGLCIGLMIFLAVKDAGLLKAAGLVGPGNRMAATVLLTPLVYFLLRVKVTGRTSLKFVAIWLISLLVSYNFPTGPFVRQVAVPSTDVAQLAETVPAEAEPSTTASDIDPQILADFGTSIAACWSFPVDATKSSSLRLRLLPNGDLDGDPTAVSHASQATWSQADAAAAASAHRAAKRCAPYTDLLAKTPALAGRDIIATFDPEGVSVTAELAPSPEGADGPISGGTVSEPRLVTDAVKLVLEIEGNAAAAMQQRSTAQLYRLTATRTSLQDGIVYLEQDIGANNVVYATIYCAFNEVAVDASRIPIGGTKTYSAVLYDVSVSQRQASSGFATGVINFKEIVFSSCQIAD